MADKYLNIKNMILGKIGTGHDLNKIKSYFKADIDSLRTFNRITSIADLIAVLEERDVLSYQCPMPLFYIGMLLNDADIESYVTFYKRLYLKEDETFCVCGKKLEYNPSFDSSLNLDGNCLKVNSYSTASSDAEVLEAIKNISHRIPATNWRVLTSELKIKEHLIDEIYKRHPNDGRSQAHAALMCWYQNEKENATIDVLDKALEARLCRLKGIGLHMKEPLASL